MKYLDEFSDPGLAAQLLEEIRTRARRRCHHASADTRHVLAGQSQHEHVGGSAAPMIGVIRANFSR